MAEDAALPDDISAHQEPRRPRRQHARRASGRRLGLKQNTGPAWLKFDHKAIAVKRVELGGHLTHVEAAVYGNPHIKGIAVVLGTPCGTCAAAPAGRFVSCSSTGGGSRS